MFTTIDDIHHRHRQGIGAGPTHIAVKGQPGLVSGGLGHSQGDTENGVGPETAFVFGAVEVDHEAVDH